MVVIGFTCGFPCELRSMITLLSLHLLARQMPECVVLSNFVQDMAQGLHKIWLQMHGLPARVYAKHNGDGACCHMTSYRADVAVRNSEKLSRKYLRPEKKRENKKSIWMAFGGNTRDLGSIGEETDKTMTLHRSLLKNFVQCLETASQFLATPSYLTSDGVRTLMTASERSRLKRNPIRFGEATREEINDRMTEMFRLFKELTASRTPEKVLIREEARHPITKNINSISLIIGEVEKSANNNAMFGNSIENPDGSDAVVPLKGVEKENEAENGTKNKPVKSAKKKPT
ncbi:hypothetical protein Tco_0532332 [Tanacetum coccineum]